VTTAAQEPTRRVIAAKYEVRGVLGEGATGVVYDAVGPDGAAVALKVMHATLAGDEQIRGRFRREAAILRRLEGAHVCPILESGEAPGEMPGTTVLFLALPRIEGPSLDEALAAGPIAVDRALAIELEILDALASAHGHGIIHRDLKPANVLLRGGKDVVVVDFGMAKIVTGTQAGTTNLTKHNMVFGTPEYMSPEQARGDEIDPRCDVYAAGVILHEMLTGAQPFTGASPLAVLTAHLTSDLVPPATRPGAAGRVTPALEAVLVKALARDRDARYASAAAFAEALRAAGTTVEPKTPSRAPEAFAATVPATMADGAKAAVDAHATTLNGEQPPTPTMVSSIPIPLAALPPKPSIPPPSSGAAPRPERVESNRGWIVAWVVVGLLSIATGVWFALR
jgi:serine/threonine-protein kinase